jgi:hypothetical protein
MTQALYAHMNKKKIKRSVEEDVEKQKSWHTLAEDINWLNHYGK